MRKADGSIPHLAFNSVAGGRVAHAGYGSWRGSGTEAGYFNCVIRAANKRTAKG